VQFGFNNFDSPSTTCTPDDSCTAYPNAYLKARNSFYLYPTKFASRWIESSKLFNFPVGAICSFSLSLVLLVLLFVTVWSEAKQHATTAWSPSDHLIRRASVLMVASHYGVEVLITWLLLGVFGVILSLRSLYSSSYPWPSMNRNSIWMNLNFHLDEIDAELLSNPNGAQKGF
jgi:hypothetical protein